MTKNTKHRTPKIIATHGRLEPATYETTGLVLRCLSYIRSGST